MIAFVLSGGASLGSIQVGQLRALYEHKIAPSAPAALPQTVLASDFSHADELIEQGYELAAEALDHPDPAGFATPRALEALAP
jgi:predicted acylesterase/phospholipase RssA